MALVDVSNELNAQCTRDAMLIKLDVREAKLKSQLESLLLVSERTRARLVMEQLPLGDVILCDDDGKERVIIERKSLPDLAASIVDGRYKEQGRRLEMMDFPPHNIYYLLEGDILRFRSKCRTVNSDTIRSTIVSLSFLKGFSVHSVQDVAESARWILKFADRLHGSKHRGKYEDVGVGSPAASEPPATGSFVDVCSRVKKDQISPDNALPIMLAQIPGVSTVTAEAIASVYPTIYALVRALKDNPDALEGLTTTSRTGKTRKVAKSVRTRVRTFLGIENLSLPSSQDA